MITPPPNSYCRHVGLTMLKWNTYWHCHLDLSNIAKMIAEWLVNNGRNAFNTIIFCFSQDIFYSLMNKCIFKLHFACHLQIPSDWTTFNAFPNKPWVLRVFRTSLLKRLRKGKISPFPTVFSTYLENCLPF